MSTPAPRFSPGMLSKTLVQAGGPISVSSGATSAAITFGDPFPDISYGVDLAWVSGGQYTFTTGSSGLGNFGMQSRDENYCIAIFPRVTAPSAFIWRAWRVT